MRSSASICLCLAACSGTVLAPGRAPDAPPAPVVADEVAGTDRWLREGTWVHRGPRTVTGRGTDTVVELVRKREGWVLRRTQVHHPHVGRGEVTTSRAPDVRVTADGTWLRMPDEHAEAAVTYRFDGDTLVVPAVVETTPRSWIWGLSEFVHTGLGTPTVHRWECLDDPRDVDEGDARFSAGRGAPAASPHPQRFRVERDASTGAVTAIEFLDVLPEREWPRARLEWLERWGVHAGGTPSYRSRQARYDPVDPDSRYASVRVPSPSTPAPDGAAERAWIRW